MVADDIKKGLVLSEGKILRRRADPDGLAALSMQIAPVVQEVGAGGHAQGVGARQELPARLIQQVDAQIARLGKLQPINHARAVPQLEGDGRRQAGNRSARLQGDRALDAVDDICPAVLGQHGETKGLADTPERRQDRPEPLGPAGDQLEPGHVGHLDEVVGGEGVDEHLEGEVGLDRRLHPIAGRAVAPVAKPHRDCVALPQKAVGNAHEHGADPWPDVVAIGLELQHRAVARDRGRVVGGFGIGELWAARVRRRAPADLDGAGIVDAEVARGVGDRDLLVRSRHEAAGWRDRHRADPPLLIRRKRH